MLDCGVGSLEAAYRRGAAVGGFNVYNLETVLGICRAAEQHGAPVILQTGERALEHGGEALAAACLAAARGCGTAVGVHLDHSRDLSLVADCLRLGYSSVMVDGSHLPFADNVRMTAEAVAMAREHGAWVEGELGSLPGDEDVAGPAEAAGLTDPAEAQAFVAETGVDALAVAIGNVHGRSSAPVRLDIGRLAEIRASVGVPLVLHGASGLEASVMQRALALGVAKVNLNTDLRRALFEAVGPALVSYRQGWDLLSLSNAMIDAVESVVAAKIAELGGTPTG